MHYAKNLWVVESGSSMDTNFLKAQAERCRLLAESADEFTKRRLLDLAAQYDRRLSALGRHSLSQSAAQYQKHPNANLSASPPTGLCRYSKVKR